MVSNKTHCKRVGKQNGSEEVVVERILSWCILNGKVEYFLSGRDL
jgi:hypothetical protein